MSWYRKVPAAVPLVDHGSAPCTPSFAVKTRRLPIGVSWEGEEVSGPGRMSLTRRVPAAVPSVTQSSWPWTPSSSWKKRRLPDAKAGELGRLEIYGHPGSVATVEVPAAVPSVFQRKQWLASSTEVK